MPTPPRPILWHINQPPDEGLGSGGKTGLSWPGQTRFESALPLTGRALWARFLPTLKFQCPHLLNGGHGTVVGIKCGEAWPVACVQRKPGAARSCPPPGLSPNPSSKMRRAGGEAEDKASPQVLTGREELNLRCKLETPGG